MGTSRSPNGLLPICIVWLACILGCAGGGQSLLPLDRPAESLPRIALLSSRGERSSDSYFTIHGEVQNMSSVPARALFAVGNFRDATGGLIRSESYVVEPTDIPPGAKGTFTIMTRYTPEIKSYEILFRDVSGHSIESEDFRSPTNQPKKKK
jgi:hypothetical protein